GAMLLELPAHTTRIVASSARVEDLPRTASPLNGGVSRPGGRSLRESMLLVGLFGPFPRAFRAVPWEAELLGRVSSSVVHGVFCAQDSDRRSRRCPPLRHPPQSSSSTTRPSLRRVRSPP